MEGRSRLSSTVTGELRGVHVRCSFAVVASDVRCPLAATFARRGTAIPVERPLVLTPEFTDDPQKKIQWAAFVRRTRRSELSDLSAIVGTLQGFLWPALQAARRQEPWQRTWTSGGPGSEHRDPVTTRQ